MANFQPRLCPGITPGDAQVTRCSICAAARPWVNIESGPAACTVSSLPPYYLWPHQVLEHLLKGLLYMLPITPLITLKVFYFKSSKMFILKTMCRLKQQYNR